MPTNDILNKYNYIEEGLFPEKCGLSVYPANDLFLYGGKDMYSDLNESEINKWREFGVNANFIDSKEFLKN